MKAKCWKRTRHQHLTGFERVNDPAFIVPSNMAMNELHRVERNLFTHKMPYEILYQIDPAWGTMNMVVGVKDSVPMTREEFAWSRDKIITHNHPGNDVVTLSGSDVAFALLNGVRIMRAVSDTGKVASLSISLDIPHVEAAEMAAIAKEWEDQTCEWIATIGNYSDDEIADIFNTLWIRFCDMSPYLYYTLLEY